MNDEELIDDLAPIIRARLDALYPTEIEDGNVAASIDIAAVIVATLNELDVLRPEPVPEPVDPTNFERQTNLKNKLRYALDTIAEPLSELLVDEYNRNNAIRALNDAYRYAETAIGKEWPIV
jgi:hypothetical protein